MNNARGFLILLGLTTPGAISGCGGDDCRLGEGKCEGNSAWLCGNEGHEAQSPTVWRLHQDCGALFCKSSPNGAVCSLTDAKDPRCDFSANLWPGAGVCEGSTAVQCSLGYPVQLGPDCQSPALCQPGGIPFTCAAPGGFHPVCQQLNEPNLYVRTSCYNNAVLFCREGRLLDYTDCAVSSCTVGAPPPAGAELCAASGKCVPYAPEPLAACQP